MKGFRYLDGTTSVNFDETTCISCGMCLEVCPHQVFAEVENLVRVADRDACMECGACMRNCPVTAIFVDAGVGCATGLINAWLRAKNLSGPSDNCCC